jgi:hypothetical protein
MENKIKSTWYTNNNDMLFVRWYLDENAVLWFNYKDLYEYLYLSGRKAVGMYKDLNEINKHMFADLNNDNDTNRHIETPFINEEGIKEIEDKNNNRFKLLYKNLNVIRYNASLTDNYREKSYKDVMKEFLCEAIDNDELVEFTVKESKYELDFKQDDEGIMFMYKKEIPNEEEERIVKYKRHEGRGTTCPVWLKDVIK